MKHPHIPRTWTGDQALEVVELLQGLLDAVWDVYGHELTEALARRSPPHDDRQAELPL
ncbi:MAG: hypothetical protein GY723_16640 [bacterium]|nr:hypothetical protein [bacterium]